MDNPNKLINDLRQFTGTENWYRNPLFPLYLYTDGIKYLVEEAQSYWLIDYIFSNQIDAKIKQEPFQAWQIKVVDETAFIEVEDGNDNLIKEFKIPYTDFPLAELTLWFTDRTLLLPSEY